MFLCEGGGLCVKVGFVCEGGSLCVRAEYLCVRGWGLMYEGGVCVCEGGMYVYVW